MRKGDQSGFSIIELAIVVLIIGILAALAIPFYAMIMERSRFATLASDLRTFGDAYRSYAVEKGEYPPDFQNPGIIDPVMAEYLPFRWTERTPIGGAYQWRFDSNPDPAVENAYIEIVENGNNVFNIELDDLVRLDERIDDGNTATGHLQTDGVRVWYFVKLGQK